MLLHFNILLLAIILMFMVETLLPQNNAQLLAQLQDKNISPNFIGVAMRGNSTSEKEHDENDIPFPKNYYEDSFKLIHDAGMNHVRYLFYWESYAKNPSLFLEELVTVAQAADRWGIKVLYDNHQWHTSSWLESKGTGFPSFLFSGNAEYERDSGGNTNDKIAKLWWTNWWDRSVKDENGNDGWTLHAQFLTTIVRALDGYESTLGYEILSEPQIHRDDQWEKVGDFNTFIVGQLRKETEKTLAFSQQVPASFRVTTISVNPENQAKMVPSDKTNVIFKISMYGTSTDTFQRERLNGLVRAAQISQVPVYVGEWNNVVRERSGEVFEIDPEQSDLTDQDVESFLRDFKAIGAWGWAFWQWNFNPHRIPNFNLITISEDGAILPTKYYQQLKTAILR